ncbi:unnamed protein product [Thlaspi arvense]|uniref:Glycosyltransferase n=1 Tax=Thlaspi arvense TaxID=13288 RepID=A0AAU9RTQ7_THLAR|nr:unnamed protein product [Thlaspi arvense]
MKTAELVFIPFPEAGHIFSSVEMAKLLAGRDQRLSITVLIMHLPFETKFFKPDTSNPQRIRFVDIPLDESVMESISKERPHYIADAVDFFGLQKPQVRNAVSQLISESSEASQLAGFVIDMFTTSMMEVADEFGAPTYAFLTSGAGILGLVFHLYTLQEDFGKDLDEYKDSDTELSVPAFSKPVPAKVLPAVVFDKETGGLAMMNNFASKFKKTKGILINTFEELESHAVKSLLQDHTVPTVYPVGPIVNLDNKKSEEAIMTWLDDQPASSVVFLCFGSKSSFKEDQSKEIAYALERAGHRFLWSIRTSPAKGKSGVPGECENPKEFLPEGFLERTADIGKVIGWAPQVAVLSHPAVGGFVSHCGWNSTLESLWFGVPTATWPLYAEQQINAFLMARDFGLAVEIKLDYKQESFPGDGPPVLVTAEEIENGIRRLMEGDETVEIRERVKKMSEKSRSTLKEDGSSHAYLGQFIKAVVDNVS